MKHRKTAADWHGGQWSALYAFASTGTIVPGLESEIETILRDKIASSERRKLNALLKFVRYELANEKTIQFIRSC